jgi:hypothetical protein
MGARYTDARGRLYSMGPNFAIGPNGEATSSDTAPIIRLDRATKKTDTLRSSTHPRRPSARRRVGPNVSIRAGGGNPFAAADDWAVTPDGRLAIVPCAGLSRGLVRA